jgi:hypothetical protein
VLDRRLEASEGGADQGSYELMSAAIGEVKRDNLLIEESHMTSLSIASSSASA